MSELVLELTERCPLRCVHCSSCSGTARAGELAHELVLHLIEDAASLGAAQVSFGGGEPFCSSLLEKALAQAAGLGLATEVFTCGCILTDGSIAPFPDRVVGRLSHSDAIKLIFSIHGPAADIHDSVTLVPNSFACMLDSLDRCVAAGVRCEMNFVPLRMNVKCLDGIVALAGRHGVGRVSVLRFVPQGRGLTNRGRLELSPQEEADFVRDLLVFRARTRIEIRTGSPFNGIVPGNCVPCRAGAAKLVVQADGNVLPCEVFKHSCRKNWGLSVYEHSLREILGSPQILALRARIQESDGLQCPVHHGLVEHSKGEE